MEKECKDCGGSIYFQCRKEAAKYNDRLSSREGASEMLNISVSSLSNYELGLTPVPTDVVVRMADLYGAPELEACYCKNDCPIGKRQNIATKIRGIEQITCSLLDHADDDLMHGIKRDLINIASDGKLDLGEENRLRKIVTELSQFADDVMELRMFLRKYGGESDGID
ncbi:hypothetical protein KGMB01110_24540 [Mediterraneibacter butyricigenes]|uniref:HTH cro/C1-type domain-containing protein n=1 Tax=Mediterraneibacter butyricigenes TaxID=2316025 RepID=A0A391PAJ5_9FIRM|nr:helix-turn-helix transcriptional regulator [Mediterraneibacter butyricigenes]GCA68018.1 hypothetical protein KGMB01110_24540 [Mediterraneibacter butyricigenes]